MDSTARVELWSGDDGFPEMLIEVVGTVVDFDAVANFTVGSSTHTLLEPSTRYWVVVHEVGDFDWGNTLDPAVTPASTGSLPEVTALSADGGATWTDSGTDSIQKMRVSVSPDVNVTSTEGDNSDGSLRGAIEEVGEGARILFDSDLDGETIRLNGTQLYVDKSLVIDASDLPNGITISGDRSGDGESSDDSRVFRFNGNIDVALKSLNLTGGRASDGFSSPGGDGGGINNSFATLTLKRCTIAGNRAGDGLDGRGNGDGDGDGDGDGGIYNVSGTVILEQCTVANNRAGNADVNAYGGCGGGIY